MPASSSSGVSTARPIPRLDVPELTSIMRSGYFVPSRFRPEPVSWIAHDNIVHGAFSFPSSILYVSMTSGRPPDVAVSIATATALGLIIASSNRDMSTVASPAPVASQQVVGTDRYWNSVIQPTFIALSGFPSGNRVVDDAVATCRQNGTRLTCDWESQNELSVSLWLDGDARAPRAQANIVFVSSATSTAGSGALRAVLPDVPIDDRARKRLCSDYVII